MQLDAAMSRRIDSIFAPWDRPDSPGVALAILRGEELVYSRGYGQANLEYGIPITPETVFHVASVSKQFTAMAIVLLQQQGLVDLQADIHAYLPELPDFGQTITLWHLLHHTSGLRDQWELLVAAGWRMDDVITREQILGLVQRQRSLNFPPGSEYLYCNTGFTLAAEVVQRVTGQSLRQFCAEQIFQPLQMLQTHFHDDHEEIVPNRAYSYAARADAGWRKSVLSYANVGATSLFTTALDLVRWLRNFEHGLVGGQAAITEMQTPFTLADGHPTEYGLGLMLGSYRGLSEIGHSGADAGFRSWCGRFPQPGLGIVVLTNAAGFVPRDLAHQVADLLLPELASSPGEQALPKAVDYLGDYLLLTDGSELTIRQSGEQLLLDLPGQPDLPLQPFDRDAWDCPQAGVKVIGQRLGDGSLSGLVLQSQLRSLAARRRPQFALTTTQLAEYPGRYYSAELDTYYQVVAGERGLLVRHLRQPDLLLLPAAVDRFLGASWRVGSVEFQRDSAGQVSGMSWSGNRVRNLWFERS